jgi:hypothetical protein
MKKHKYFTKNENNKWEEVPLKIANDVIRQYFERRYMWSISLGLFIIGFLLGVVANG